MRHMRKLLALALAVMLVLSLATSAFAAEGTTITITGGATGSQYAAYKLLNATNSDDDKALFAYTLNDKYTAILQAVTGKTEQADIIAYIAEQDTATETRAFADAVYAAIKTAGLEADYTATDDVFADVAQGYYLIAETKTGDTSDTYSLVMLDTKGDDEIEVATKEDKPTVDKNVQEKNDTTGDSSWGETADYDVNDVINYEIVGTVSNKYVDYKSYYYSFSDTMDKGLTYNGDAKVYVVNGETKTDVTSQFTIATTTNSETGLANGFTATANLKELTDVTITASTTIVVEYTATLNEHAVSGTTGNKNTVVLEYENNPYHNADGDPTTPDKPEEPDGPGKTPPVVNVVFTFDVVVDKVDKDGNALEGAGFTLYKWIDSGVEDDESTTNVDESGSWVAVQDEITGETTFAFEKLDEGKYKLVETTVPEGYNKAADVEFEITSTLTDTALTELTVTPSDNFTVTLESGKIETDVVNNAGTELPETGGIGTTIFYVLGGILVLAAVVLLVTKKRMSVN